MGNIIAILHNERYQCISFVSSLEISGVLGIPFPIPFNRNDYLYYDQSWSNIDMKEALIFGEELCKEVEPLIHVGQLALNDFHFHVNISKRITEANYSELEERCLEVIKKYFQFDFSIRYINEREFLRIIDEVKFGKKAYRSLLLQ